MGNIEGRLRKLERLAPDKSPPPLWMIQEADESEPDAIARAFPEGVPADRLLIIRRIVDPRRGAVAASCPIEGQFK